MPHRHCWQEPLFLEEHKECTIFVRVSDEIDYSGCIHLPHDDCSVARSAGNIVPIRRPCHVGDGGSMHMGTRLWEEELLGQQRSLSRTCCCLCVPYIDSWT